MEELKLKQTAYVDTSMVTWDMPNFDTVKKKWTIKGIITLG